MTLSGPAIVVAEDLSPSMTATLPREHILGILLEGGSPTAHAAILARAYGIPAVVGGRGMPWRRWTRPGPDAELVLDGATGEVVVAPDAATGRRVRRPCRPPRPRPRGGCLRGVAAGRHHATASRSRCSRTSARRRRPAPARALGARGVGLFRTEFLFLERTTPPTEDEQAAAYREAVEAFGGDPVTIRLLDIGGDKPIPYLPMPAEENPFLGVRALRLAHDRPELFVTQLRACYRAAAAGPGEGHGADGRGRRGRDAAARPRARGRGRSWRQRASRSGPWTSA